MIRLLHIPFLAGLMALMAFGAPEEVIKLVGAFTLGLSFGIEAVLTLTADPQAYSTILCADHDWELTAQGDEDSWRCLKCGATCRTPRRCGAEHYPAPAKAEDPFSHPSGPTIQELIDSGELPK